jgi:hypothetical protein
VQVRSNSQCAGVNQTTPLAAAMILIRRVNAAAAGDGLDAAPDVALHRLSSTCRAARRPLSRIAASATYVHAVCSQLWPKM